MEILLYPSFETVFADQQLEGIFYPLCSVQLADQYRTRLFFVSSNGTWTNDDHRSESNDSRYTQFKLVEGRYSFDGNIGLYRGYEVIRGIYQQLVVDFEQHGKNYLSQGVKTNDYIDSLVPRIAHDQKPEFDLFHYMEMFYQYSVNKLRFAEFGALGGFAKMIASGAEEFFSPVVHDLSLNANAGFKDIEENAEFIFPDSIGFAGYARIGQVKGNEFFNDGNDCSLLYNAANGTVLLVNSDG